MRATGNPGAFFFCKLMHVAAIAAKCTGPVIKKQKRRIYIATHVRQASTNRSYSISTFHGAVKKGGDNLSVKAAGIPNITGNFRGTPCTSASGSFSRTNNSDPLFRSPADQNETNKSIYSLITFNASETSVNAAAVYGKSSTVQPPALQLIPQIRY